jgi:hypothetical protein
MFVYLVSAWEKPLYTVDTKRIPLTYHATEESARKQIAANKKDRDFKKYYDIHTLVIEELTVLS